MDSASLKSARATSDVATASSVPALLHRDDQDGAELGVTKFRLYKRRWLGLVAIAALNIVAGLPLAWFGPIEGEVIEEYGFSVTQVNWLSNVINLTFIPFSVVVPHLYARIGMRRSCYVGAALFIVSAWVRYAGTAHSLSSQGAYALFMLGQVISGISQPVFQVLVPNYSEKWFDLKTRITATMIMTLGNPVGGAIGQLISPALDSPSQSVLVMAIMFTAVTPLIFLVGNAPPTPPTHAGSVNPTFASFVRALLGKESRTSPAYTTPRQRVDFAIMTFVFGVLVSAVNVFSVLSAQILNPYGYSDTQAGLLGSTLLLTGIVSAFITAPIFDRVLSHHLAWTSKALTPVIAAGWLSLVWAVKRNDASGLYGIMAVIGVSSLALLPVAIELAVEVTKNADASSAVLWCSSNVFALAFTLAEGALRASEDADPPLNMHRALVFQACWVCGAVGLVMCIQGRQTRREADDAAVSAVVKGTGPSLGIGKV